MTNSEYYRAAFTVRAPEDVVQAALTRAAQTRHQRRPCLRYVLAAAAILALLILSVSAVSVKIFSSHAAKIAESFRDSKLAEAFDSGDSIILNETVQSGEFNITLVGLVSGVGLTEYPSGGVDTSRTYAILELERLDGTPMNNQSLGGGVTDYTLTPLVSGYAPWRLNLWYLHSTATGGAMDGKFYYLIDTQDITIFADHTVYLAFYKGFAPDNSMFVMAEDGSISFAEDFEGVHALFTLPLDPSLADPEAVAEFIKDLWPQKNDRGQTWLSQ